MCDPMTIAIASTAATAGGTMLNRRTENQAIKAQNKANLEARRAEIDARNEEQQRQDRFADQQAAAVMDTLKVADPGTKVAEVQKIAETSPVAQQRDMLQDAPVPQAGVDREVAAGVNQSVQSARKRIEAMAKLAAFGGTMAGVGDTMQGAGDQIANVNSFRRGSMDVSGLERSIPAPMISPSQSPMGDLLIAGGQIGSVYGGSMAGQAGTDPFATSLEKLKGLWGRSAGGPGKMMPPIAMGVPS